MQSKREGFFYGKSSPDSFIQSTGVNSYFIGPIWNALGLAVKSIFFCYSSIAALKANRQPSNIIGGVIASRINSVERHSFWAISEYGKKAFESVKFRSYGNALAAIPFPVIICRSLASIPHSTPRSIGFRIFSPFSLSMGCRSHGCACLIPAATGFCRTLAHAIFRNRLNGSALALTEPAGICPRFSGTGKLCNNSQSSELLAYAHSLGF